MAALRKRRAVAEAEQSADSQAQLEFENTVNESNEPQESMGENQSERSADDSENQVAQESNAETESSDVASVVNLSLSIAKEIALRKSS